VGVLLEFTCQRCGYAARVSDGHGFLGIEQAAGHCLDCAEIRTVEVGAVAGSPGRPRCRACGGENITLLPERGPTRVREKACLRCGGDLHVYPVGI
jgi:hypothetical protein